ncbi:cytochrome P450 [Actinomadura kijaniata]|uniref:Cytochrome P450 n=1 Tax=Actinomadura namibiensis TaxID=182080 RepID=A0A7W3QQV1_ACTNM|nr:cytochrome P450 [Actinomadura namibiensis]MBA8956125.1 cytochrome P450 [Actinomadura namibiensis]
MNALPPAITEMPTRRPAGRPFDPPAELARIRAQGPITPLLYDDGRQRWLVTGHAQARAVLADPRFSSRYEIAHYLDPQYTDIPPAGPGEFIGMDAPEHTRFRRLLAGRFSVRRMGLLTERVRTFTAECLDDMAGRGPGADLVETFAHPVPAQMICELLGVPYAERGDFQRFAGTLNRQDVTLEERTAAAVAIGEYMTDLVRRKRAEPTDDLLSELTDSDLTEEEHVGVGGMLLAAGLDTVANMLGLGTFALLTHPDQLAVLRDDPDAVDRGVEELLRYLTIAHTDFRTALEDVEIDGVLIGKGATLAISLLAANRDPAVFPDPDTLDLRRDAAGQMAFAHGAHQCLGQQLARMELRIALPALLNRFPTLRLAIPAEEVPVRSEADVYGVERLPVAWDPA